MIYTTFVLYTISLLSFVGANESIEKPNILLLVVDDLRAQSKGYVKENGIDNYVQMKHLDNFADNSFTMLNFHVQQSICGPSRFSMLTGIRPDSFKVWQHKNIQPQQKTMILNAPDIPKALKNRGYRLFSGGKLYHWRDVSKKKFKPGIFKNTPFKYPSASCGTKLMCPESSKQKITDIELKNWTVARIKKLARQYSRLKNKRKTFKPFFMMVGFYRPHRPYKVPKQYMDMYDVNDIPAALPDETNYEKSKIPVVSFASCDYRHYTDIGIKTNYDSLPLSVQLSKEIRKGYFAASTFIDDLIGEILDTINDTPLKENTVIVITSDHGYALGEFGRYCKMTNFEESTRVPFYIRHPYLKETYGKSSNVPVEMIDLLPTLVDLTGMDDNSLSGHPEGKSFLPLLEDLHYDPDWYAFTENPRCYDEHDIDVDCNMKDSSKEIKYMGYSIRTKKWRYTEWHEWDQQSGIQALWGESKHVIARELYDHRNSNGKNNLDHERDNVFKSHPNIVDKLSKELSLIYSTK